MDILNQASTAFRMLLGSVFGLAFLLNAGAAYSQITYTSADNRQGDWDDVSTWTFSPASETWAPAKPNNPTNSNANAITVNGYVRIESGGLIINNANPVVTVNDTLFINGNVSLGSGASLNVVSGGILVIIGDLTLGGSFNLANGGNIVVTGDVSVPNGNIQNNANFYVFDDTRIPAGGGGTINGCNAYSGCVPTDAGNIGDEDDLLEDNEELFNFVASGGTTPISLIKFTAKPSFSQGIIIAWSTASEYNFDQFIIQRAVLGNEFEEIARVKGAGFSKVRNDYGLLDYTTPSGRIYYRLTALDFDGSTETFPIIAVEYDGERRVDLYPNPARRSEDITIRLNFEPETGDFFRILDINGREVRNLTPGSSETHVLLRTSGIYVVEFVSNSIRSTVRLVVD